MLNFNSNPVSSRYHKRPFTLTVNELKLWTADGPLADKRNIVTVPLAKRFTLSGSQFNPERTNQMEIAIVPDGMNGLGNYLEEQDKFNLYNFTHWSYIDKIVWFGGPNLIPAAPWVNAAHKNGVKVLGNIFFPPNVYGGTNEIVTNFLEKDSEGHFIAARKMAAISTYYRFDGWFVNMETNTTPENGALMLEFVAELRSLLPEGQEVMWYDAMLPSGRVWWQNELNERNSMFFQKGNQKVSDDVFVNFFWPGKGNPQVSTQTAKSLGRSEFDVFTGVDLWPGRSQQPFDKGGNDWMSALHKEGKPLSSLGLFVPNHIFQHPDYSQFRKDASQVDKFYSFERHMFSGADENPANVDISNFKGIGHWVPATSVITALPFATSFNTGHGKILAQNGIIEAREWHNMSVQDILPTWQFALEGTAGLSVGFDFEKAYNGGSSLKIEGELKANSHTTLKLYKTKLSITDKTKIDLVYQKKEGGASHMQVIYAFSDAPDILLSQPIGHSGANIWQTKTLDLSKESGRELAILGLAFKSDQEVIEYQVNIGELRVYNE